MCGPSKIVPEGSGVSWRRLIRNRSSLWSSASHCQGGESGHFDTTTNPLVSTAVVKTLKYRDSAARGSRALLLCLLPPRLCRTRYCPSPERSEVNELSSELASGTWPLGVSRSIATGSNPASTDPASDGATPAALANCPIVSAPRTSLTCPAVTG